MAKRQCALGHEPTAAMAERTAAAGIVGLTTTETVGLTTTETVGLTAAGADGSSGYVKAVTIAGRSLRERDGPRQAGLAWGAGSTTPGCGYASGDCKPGTLGRVPLSD